MLAVSTARSSSSSNNNGSSFDCSKNGDIQMEISCVAANNINNDWSAGFSRDIVVDFPSDFSATGNLLDSIDFDDLFAGINQGSGSGTVEDELPDMEIDPQELLAEFSGLSGGEDSFSCRNYDINYSNYVMIGGDGGEGCNYDIIDDDDDDDDQDINNTNEFNNHEGNYVMNYISTVNVGNTGGEGEDKVSSSAMEKSKQDVEAADIENKKTELKLISSSANNNNNNNNNNNRVDRGGKNSSPKGKNNNTNNSSSNIRGDSSNAHGKRKTKVDWTPELHRRFVQAVEQLGVDKAVPSRILELMDIDCLTRHNVASHLQKYRSHRRHLLAKEAEAASWTHKRQMYGVAVAPSAAAPVAGTATGKAGGRTASHSHPWNGPTMGFPPPTMPPQPMHRHHHLSFRPLHVWGHPTHHQIETRHHHQSMMHMWRPKHHPPPPPPPHHAFWHSHHQRRFGAPPAVPSIIPTPPHPAIMYSNNNNNNNKRHQDTPAANPPLDFHPTKESVDAAIGDVLFKPWLPLPIGLKPPSVDSVLVELQRQGIPKIPPLHSCSSTS